ncbi:MAG: FtsX-like permease family protein [Acidobacteriota bacterium]
MSKLSFEWRLAARFLKPRRSQALLASVTLLCGLGVAVGVAALVLALAFLGGLQGEWKTRLLAANAHVVVRPVEHRSVTPVELLGLIERCEEEGAVTGAAPYWEEPGLLSSHHHARGLFVQVRGVDPAREPAVTGLDGMTSSRSWELLVRAAETLSVDEDPAGGADGSEAGDSEDDELLPLSLDELAPPPAPPVLLGHRLALRLGVSTGDLVHLVSPQAELSALGAMPRRRSLEVAGLLTTGVAEYDDILAVVPLGSRRARGGAARIDGLSLSVQRPLVSAQVAGRLAERLPPDYLVTDWTTTFSRLFAAFAWEKLIMTFALGLIGLVAGFNIFTILSMNVMARVTDVGVLGALGARPASLRRLFTWMGLLLGGAGTLVGLVLGTVLSLVLDATGAIRLDEAVYSIGHVPFDLRFGDLAWVGSGMLLVSLFSTLLPAVAASRVDPVVALRSE